MPTWEEFLTNSAPGSLEFPGPSYPIANYDEPRTSQSVAGGRGAQQISPMSSDYPSGPSSSYPDTQPTYSGQEHQAPATPSTDSCPMMVTPPALHPPTMSLARPEMKLVTMRGTPMPDLPSGTQVGRWTKREHELFLEGLQRFGKSWKKISSLVHTRTLVQIRTHAQKYLQKQSRAALKADAKAAAAAAACASQAKAMKQERQQLVDDIKTEPQYPAPPGPPDQPAANTSSSKIPDCPLDQWKAPGPTSRGYAPLVYPSGAMALSVTRTSTQIMTTTSIASPRSAFQLNTISRLDQLLQEDMNGNIPAFVDEYYTSPTAIEDDLLRPLYTSEPQWVPHLALSEGYASKRRRLERSSTAATTSTSTAGPAVRPAFPTKLFEPLPVPSNLSSPVCSPKAQQVSAVASLLAAHEATDTTNYPSQWL